MKNKNSNFNNFVAPILAIVVICLVVTFLLALTYGVTKPIIDRNTAKAANEARTKILPDAHGDFKEYKGKLVVPEKNKVYAEDCYIANNGSGMVVTAKSNSYGGLLTAMIGIDKDGAITKVVVADAADTPGVGTRAQADSHLDQYKGLSKLGNINIKQDTTVKYISGASISSEAIHKAVNCALKQYEKVGGAK